MFILGLTGGIGSGKTIIANALQTLGATLYNADLQAKLLLDSNKIIRQNLKSSFGDSIFAPDGSILKSKLGQLVFSDTAQLKKLNAIVHPVLEEEFNNWINKTDIKLYLVFEAAILIESGFAKHMDYIVSVCAPEQIRIDRVCQRDNIGQEHVKARMANQLSDEDRNKVSNFIIINDGKKLILPQIENLHQEILKKIIPA